MAAARHVGFGRADRHRRLRGAAADGGAGDNPWPYRRPPQPTRACRRLRWAGAPAARESFLQDEGRAWMTPGRSAPGTLSGRAVRESKRGRRHRTRAHSLNGRSSSSLTPRRKITPRFCRIQSGLTIDRSTLKAGVPLTRRPPGTSAESKTVTHSRAGPVHRRRPDRRGRSQPRPRAAIRRSGAGIDLPVSKGVFGEKLLEGPLWGPARTLH